MIIVVFLLSASATIFSSFDSVLDPNDITYPVGWYTNSIDLSSNHAGESVTITVNCNTKVLLLAGYLVTMTIPGFSTSKMTYSLPANQAVSSDNQFVFSSVFNSDNKRPGRRRDSFEPCIWVDSYSTIQGSDFKYFDSLLLPKRIDHSVSFNNPLL